MFSSGLDPPAEPLDPRAAIVLTDTMAPVASVTVVVTDPSALVLLLVVSADEAEAAAFDTGPEATLNGLIAVEVPLAPLMLMTTPV